MELVCALPVLAPSCFSALEEDPSDPSLISPPSPDTQRIDALGVLDDIEFIFFKPPLECVVESTSVKLLVVGLPFFFFRSLFEERLLCNDSWDCCSMGSLYISDKITMNGLMRKLYIMFKKC